MEHAEAVALIRDGVTQSGGVWADLGAGSGVFSHAISELIEQGGTVYAVDKRAGEIARGPTSSRASIVSVQADFTKPLGDTDLDGVVMANALHFVYRQEQVLKLVVSYLKPGGAFILVEYDLARATPWIPFPVTLERFKLLAKQSGLSDVREIGRRASSYGPRELYAAMAIKV